MTNQEFVRKIFQGEKISVDEALSLYANEENWGGYYPRNAEVGKLWVWKGPVIWAPEAAINALRNANPTNSSIAKWGRLQTAK